MATKKEAEKEAELPMIDMPLAENGPWKPVASTGGQDWSRTTANLSIGNGTLYLMETTIRNPDGSYALSQSSVYVPA